jgi:hypothetical protein
MFCCIEYVRGDAPKSSVVLTVYRAGSCEQEIKDYAERQRQTQQADGYRMRDLHTGRVTEVWS